MNRKLHYLIMPVVLFLASPVGAQNYMNGSIGVLEDSSLSGSYSDSSLTLDASNFTQPGSAMGTFYGLVPDGTEVTANSSDFTGLSSSPQPEAILNFLQIGTPGPAIFGSPGTTPNNRFDFDLQSLEEPAAGSFIGIGTLVDTQGDYSATSAKILLSFSSANNYSFELETVPEPTTLTLALAGFGGLGVLSFLRRKSFRNGSSLLAR